MSIPIYTGGPGNIPGIFLEGSRSIGSYQEAIHHSRFLGRFWNTAEYYEQSRTL
jgi:hypothetical protein